MFAWATLVAYSRIYMGVHYPGDVIVGAAVGTLIGFILGKIAEMINDKRLMTNGKSPSPNS